jgi:hypothetical protein
MIASTNLSVAPPTWLAGRRPCARRSDRGGLVPPASDCKRAANVRFDAANSAPSLTRPTAVDATSPYRLPQPPLVEATIGVRRGSVFATGNYRTRTRTGSAGTSQNAHYYRKRTRTGIAGTVCRCDTMSLFELFPRQRREPPVSLGESRGLNKERP